MEMDDEKWKMTMGNKHVGELLAFICGVDKKINGNCMWMKENEQLTLAGKIMVVCFKFLGWIYNSKREEK